VVVSSEKDYLPTRGIVRHRRVISSGRTYRRYLLGPIVPVPHPRVAEKAAGAGSTEQDHLPVRRIIRIAWKVRADGLLAGDCCDQFWPLAGVNVAVSQIKANSRPLISDTDAEKSILYRTISFFQPSRYFRVRRGVFDEHQRKPIVELHYDYYGVQLPSVVGVPPLLCTPP
jgi:hypothetical protein